jgi:hypothetical protein
MVREGGLWEVTRLNTEQVEALVVTILGDGISRPDRSKAFTELVKALSLEEDAVARLNLYADALDAMTQAEEFSTLGLVVNGSTVRVGGVKRVTH